MNPDPNCLSCEKSNRQTEIVFISNAKIPSNSAESVFVMKMCESFSLKGHNVTLILNNGLNRGAGNPYEWYGVNEEFNITYPKQLWFPSRPLRTLIRSYFSARIAMSLSPELIYSRSLLGAFFSAGLGSPVVYETHFPVSDGQFGNIQAKIFSRLISSPQFESLVVISEQLSKYYKSHYPALQNKIIVEHDAAEPIDSATKPMHILREKSKLQVGYIGNLYNGRGIKHLIELGNKCEWADFHVVGGTNSEVEFWKSKTCNGAIEFHGFVPHSEVPRYLLSFDVLIAPYQRDVKTRRGHNTVEFMSPLKIFEYMSAGKAIVCSDLPVIQEILIHEENAILCDPTDLDEWEYNLKRLQTNNQLRENLGRNAEEQFYNNHTWEHRIENILEVLCSQS